MTITRDTAQDCSASTTNGTSATANYPSGPPLNKTLIAGAMLATVQANVTLPTGWTKLVGVDLSTVLCAIIAAKETAASEPTAVQFSMAGQPASDVFVAAYQYGGLILTSVANALDKTASNSSGSQVATLATGTTAATTQAEELLFAIMGLSAAVTAPSWSLGTIIGSLSKLLVSQRIVNATGTYNDTASWTNNAFPAGAIATLKAAPVVEGSHWSMA